MTLTLLVTLCTPSEMVTTKSYVPALVNVAIVLLAAFVPLALKPTGAGGVPVVAHVYVSPASPASSLPRAPSCVVAAVTGEGVALAGVMTVGAASLVAVTLTTLIVE